MSGEYRRCLVTLEHRGLLGAEVIDRVCESLKPQLEGTSSSSTTPLTSSQQGILSAVYLAACCLFHLREPEDTLTLLEPLIIVEDHRVDSIVDHIKMLIPNQFDNVNIMAGQNLFLCSSACLTGWLTGWLID